MFSAANHRYFRALLATLLGLATSGAVLADAVTTVFTYQGSLKASGSPADGVYDMRFRLYDAATAGNQVGSMEIHDGVTNPSIIVEDGLFTVKLDFGAVFDGTALWLEIEVRPDGPTGYTTLQPRQPLCATPFAAYALNAGGPWQKNGTDVYYSQGDVGIGVDDPLAPLHVVGEIHSRGGVSNGIYVYNPNNAAASVHLSWLNDVARIRYGGSGAGATSGFAIQGQNDSTKLRLLNNGNLGLGIDDPLARLHAAGTIRASRSDGTEPAQLVQLLTSGVGHYLSATAREANKKPLYIRNLHDETGSPLGVGDMFFQVGPSSTPLTAFQLRETGSAHFNTSIAGDEQVGIKGKLRIYNDTETLRLQAWVGSSGAVIDAENAHLQLRTGGTDRLFVNSTSGNVGIGTTTTPDKLTVNGDVRATGDLLAYSGSLQTVQIDANGSGGGGRALVRNSQGITTVDIQSDINDAGKIDIKNGSDTTITLDANYQNNDAARVDLKNGSTTTITLDANYQNSGSSRIITDVIQINGADLSEKFDVTGDTAVEPGMVVSIDPSNPGKLLVASEAYDKKVAGIISGAGGVRTGLVMGHEGTIANGEHAVALTGRVWCQVDASFGTVEPGDLLTTSATPGHAMKAADFERARGAVIGKAMTGLNDSKGMVLVLVQPQ